ncbi:MAG: TetR/AcrR family transcriptional regulator [Planctomycetota bacterium]
MTIGDPRIRQEWTDAAFAGLVVHGPDAVQVRRLALTLRVDEGTFRQHFEGLADLRAQVVAQWRKVSTVQIVSGLERLGLEPRETLVELVRRALGSPEPGYGGLPKDPGAIHVAVRTWARTSDEVAAELERLETARTAYIADLLVRAGIPAPLAERRAALAHAGLLGAEVLRGPRTFEGVRVADFVDSILAGAELG